MTEEDREYPGIGFSTWSCTKCGELFRIEQQEDGPGPVACPVCGFASYDESGFERILEEEFTQEKQEALEELKSHLRKALYRSRKL